MILTLTLGEQKWHFVHKFFIFKLEIQINRSTTKEYKKNNHNFLEPGAFAKIAGPVTFLLHYLEC